jgi:hypothetical protein
VSSVFFLDDCVQSWFRRDLSERRPRWLPASIEEAVLHAAHTKPEAFVRGFWRMSPCSCKAQAPFHQSLVYSAWVLNVARCQAEGVNFRSELYVWEDVELFLRLRDVWKLTSFALTKTHCRVGGCSRSVSSCKQPWRPYQRRT